MLQQDKTALILIDVQGNLAEQMPKRKKLFKRINLLLASAKQLELPIIWLEQLPEKLGATREEILPQLDGLSAINKCTFSGHLNAEFEQTIRDIDANQFILMGIEAHICVFQTAMALLQQGKHVHIATDAVASRDKANKEVALNRLQQNGAVLSSSEMAIFELMETTEHPAFRDIIKLVKLYS